MFARLVRFVADSLDRRGVDDVAVNHTSYAQGELYRITTGHQPNHIHDVPATRFFGSVSLPWSQEPPSHILDVDRPEPHVVSDYGRMRRGEGLWGMEPLYPEGETT